MQYGGIKEEVLVQLDKRTELADDVKIWSGVLGIIGILCGVIAFSIGYTTAGDPHVIPSGETVTTWGWYLVANGGVLLHVATTVENELDRRWQSRWKSIALVVSYAAQAGWINGGATMLVFGVDSNAGYIAGRLVIVSILIWYADRKINPLPRD